MFGVCRSSANTYVWGEDVAWLMRSAAARGDVADLERRMNGSRAFIALSCSILE
jgi:hypothetical protein